MSTNELWFTVLGPSGSGKTTLLACMNEYFSRVLPGFEAGDPETFRLLSEAYIRLEHEAQDNNHEIIFSGGIEGTDSEHQYTFTIKDGRTDIRFRFFDFPGEWLNPRDPEHSSHFKNVSEKASRSSVIIAVINSPYLMQYDGRYKDYAGIDEIEYVIENSLPHDEGDKLILLVPVKCERYLANDNDTQALTESIEREFARTIRLTTEDSPYYGRLAVGILPVKTMGNVQLSRFEVRNNEPVQVFRRITGSPFMPENSDQPLRYAMSFLLGQYKKERSRSIFSRIFGGHEAENIIASVREGIKSNIRGSKIFFEGEEYDSLPEYYND